MNRRRDANLLSPAQWRSAWRWCVVLLTALSFTLVVASSSTHIHKSTASAHDCALCSAVVDKLADVPPSPGLVHQVQFFSYLVVVTPACGNGHSISRFLPPGRGPPSTSA